MPKEISSIELAFEMVAHRKRAGVDLESQYQILETHWGTFTSLTQATCTLIPFNLPQLPCVPESGIVELRSAV